MFLKNNQAESIEEINFSVSKTKNANLSSLQQKLIPFIKKGKTCIAERGIGELNPVDFILPAVLKIKHTQPGIKALIISRTAEIIKKTTEQFHSLNDRLDSKFFFAELGPSEKPRWEASLIAKDPDIVVTTAERLIDHIRRGNIDLSMVRLAVIDEPDKADAEEFNADLHYIYSKFNTIPQTIVFTPEIHDHIAEVQTCIKRPVFITRSSSRKRIDTDYFVLKLNGSTSTAETVIPRIILSKRLDSVLVLLPREADTKQLLSKVRKSGLRARGIFSSDDVSEVATDLLRYRDSTFFIKRDSSLLHHLRGFKHLFYLYLPDSDEYERNIQLIEDSSLKTSVTVLSQNGDAAGIGKIEERLTGKMKEAQVPNLEQELKAKIKKVLKIIKEEEDAEELNVYKKIIKRNVPIFLRSYFTAYLLKEMRSKKNDAGQNGFTSLFVGVGKNRRVFPKDLVQLFNRVKNISKDDIGEIKILDNYSFIEISSGKVKDAIETLNNIDYRGRKITVNYAKKKEK